MRIKKSLFILSLITPANGLTNNLGTTIIESIIEYNVADLVSFKTYTANRN